MSIANISTLMLSMINCDFECVNLAKNIIVNDKSNNSIIQSNEYNYKEGINLLNVLPVLTIDNDKLFNKQDIKGSDLVFQAIKVFYSNRDSNNITSAMIYEFNGKNKVQYTFNAANEKKYLDSIKASNENIHIKGMISILPIHFHALLIYNSQKEAYFIQTNYEEMISIDSLGKFLSNLKDEFIDPY
ncbi:hypothetical protein [Cysteiniphilum sp. 6C5]|uniref:hypothetical protein n=1 Tax=unclassified Cysteiniphilum TaxID=2610889 RepID=UPI003F854968